MHCQQGMFDRGLSLPYCDLPVTSQLGHSHSPLTLVSLPQSGGTGGTEGVPSAAECRGESGNAFAIGS